MRRNDWSGLVNENLDYEKIRSNQIVLVQHRFAGIGAIQTVVEQIRELSESKKMATLRYECDTDFKASMLTMTALSKSVNITKNANQFTDNGEILVKACGTKVKSDCWDFLIQVSELTREIKGNLGTFL